MIAVDEVLSMLVLEVVERTTRLVASELSTGMKVKLLDCNQVIPGSLLV